MISKFEYVNTQINENKRKHAKKKNKDGDPTIF